MRFRSLLVACAFPVATTVAAQSRPTTSIGVAGQFAQPIGGLRSNIDAAWGGGVAVRHRFAGLELLGVRGDLAFLNYGHERKRVTISPTTARVPVDMSTTNNVVLFTAGPELAIRRGPVQPYIYGFAGYSYFYTESSLGGENDGGSFAQATNLGDGGLALGWGGGASIPLHFRNASVSIDAGARRTTNGVRTYMREGDITDQPDGTVSLNPRTTQADFWQFHLGASFGLRRSRR